MVIFNSKLLVYQRVNGLIFSLWSPWFQYFLANGILAMGPSESYLPKMHCLPTLVGNDLLNNCFSVVCATHVATYRVCVWMDQWIKRYLWTSQIPHCYFLRANSSAGSNLFFNGRVRREWSKSKQVLTNLQFPTWIGFISIFWCVLSTFVYPFLLLSVLVHALLG